MTAALLAPPAQADQIAPLAVTNGQGQLDLWRSGGTVRNTDRIATLAQASSDDRVQHEPYSFVDMGETGARPF